MPLDIDISLLLLIAIDYFRHMILTLRHYFIIIFIIDISPLAILITLSIDYIFIDISLIIIDFAPLAHDYCHYYITLIIIDIDYY
jgi:hypothetical protein